MDNLVFWLLFDVDHNNQNSGSASHIGGYEIIRNIWDWVRYWRSHIIEYHILARVQLAYPIHIPTIFYSCIKVPWYLACLVRRYEGTKVRRYEHTVPNIYSSSDCWRARFIFAKVIDYATVRSSFVRLLYCWLTTLCDAFRVLSTATVLRDVLIVASGVHVVVVLTHAPLVNAESTPRRLLMRRW